MLPHEEDKPHLHRAEHGQGPKTLDGVRQQATARARETSLRKIVKHRFVDMCRASRQNDGTSFTQSPFPEQFPEWLWDGSRTAGGVASNARNEPGQAGVEIEPRLHDQALTLLPT